MAKVLRDVLAKDQFETIADVKAALRGRCCELRIPCDGDTITHALDLVGSNHPLVTKAALGPPQPQKPTRSEPSRTEAAAILRTFGVDVHGPRFVATDVVNTPVHFPRLMRVSQ